MNLTCSIDEAWYCINVDYDSVTAIVEVILDAM